MEKPVEVLIQENNLKRKQLNEEDLQVYEDFLLYIRTDLRVNEYDSEVILNDVLDHLLEATSHGMSAIEFFGHDVKAHADEILQELPNESNKAIMNMVLLGVSFFYFVYFAASGIAGIFTEYKTSILSLVSMLIIVPIGGVFIIKTLFSIIQNHIFDHSKYKNIKEMAYSGIVVGVIPALLIILPNVLFKDMTQVYIPWWVYLILSIGCYLLYRTIKSKK
ncbi:DUF1129 family protein [Mammaliicoccus stepanovicii]|uniref:Membrane protein n=1 Tax=Mammaliicoccus stepanovicii TaxID=643214 RepID=A0A240A281_9STAP|nr:DUF1129 family protein [Mammaliicoccus stepanovicii]GGI39321.1 hypothetical protein GCM10010896_02800 [Mammaliicoccus stepanovicii]SNV77026.1 membrane protein [Mammaliicoccus stepanovicii]